MANRGGASMGDLFSQRRAARKQQQQQGLPREESGSSGPPKRTSFLDIQAQQEREQQQEQRYQSSSGSYRSNRNRDRDNSYSYGSRRQYQEQRYHDDLPLECGLVSSLKESFGFIYCADRPEELFFHYSQLADQRESLNIDDEVEFRVGPSKRDPSKMAAFQVRRLEPGTIVWETEEEPGKRYRGTVKQPPMISRASDQSSEGTIRVLEEDENVNDGEEGESALSSAKGPVVRFLSHEYIPTESEGGESRSFRRSDSGRLGRGDLVEFIIVTERRTKQKMAKSITLIQSERERQRLIKEQELLANATSEQGIVKTLKKDFGFLRSNRRREEVYFHYSNVELPDDNENGEEFVLKEGQEMEFLVVTEGSGQNEKVSARQVKFLPKGSVVFHTQVAEGVTGVVKRCPPPPGTSYGGDPAVGSLRLTTPIELGQDEENDEAKRVVDEVVFQAEDAPGGFYSTSRDGLSKGLWIKEGDTLLFDVVKEVVDDSYCAVPTRHKIPLESQCMTDSQEDDTNDGNMIEKAIRVVSLSLSGRAEGVVHAIKDNYGFISIAERPVDAYFRLYEVLPDSMQSDLRRSLKISEEPMQLKVGAEVQFDLWLQGRIPGSSSHHGTSSRKGGDKDSLKAQRILLLPPSTIIQTKVLAKDVKGFVSKEDPNQPYSGLIELEDELKSMPLEELHPLATKLINSFLADEGSDSLIFPDLQSIKEDQVVMKVVDTLGHGELSCSYIPVASGEANHPGRLCIKKERKVGPNGDSDTRDASHKESDENLEPDSEEAKSPSNSKSAKKKKRKPYKVKSLKLVRYDKHSLSKELENAMPLGMEDKVLCDVIQSRRSGMVSVTNIRVVERKQIERGAKIDESDKQSGVGIVSEVVTSRQFGFISMVDETASRREMLFFHTSSVVTDDDPDKPASSKTRGANGVVRKGDEVKFDIGVGKNGKPVANHVHVLPRGTLNIPTKAEKNACKGYILMEPSHTSLSNTPSRHSSGKHSPAGTGRWAQVGTEDSIKKAATGSNVKENGSILLLSDPANLFGRITQDSNHGTAKSKETSVVSDAISDDNSGAAETVDTASPPTFSLKRLPYKAGALALHGTGASSLSDSSSAPRRGDLVSFVSAKGGKGVRDIRVVNRGAATLLRGRLENIVLAGSAVKTERKEDESSGTATFIAATEKEEAYQIDLDEVVSCDPSLLKNLESVEGVLHDGHIYGVCRTTDLYLESKLGANHKERPRLNLTVRKELKNRGGKIMAQSMMAKGPDGTNGFASGWTKRTSQYVAHSEHELPPTPGISIDEDAEKEGGEEPDSVTEEGGGHDNEVVVA